MQQEIIRKKLKEIKEEQGITYNYFATKIGMTKGSFYNFISGSRELSEEKQRLLKNERRRLNSNVFF